MLTQSSAKLVCESISRNIVIVSWPDQAHDRERLERQGAPRLWLVEPGVDPPIGESCLEDWLRLPADDADVRARLISLARRAEHHPSLPTIDDHGQLARNGAVVILSPLEHQIAAPLIEHFGDPVADDVLIASAWDRGGSEDTLRVHVSRLRRRLAPVGLKIVSVRAFGYVMRDEI
jgi:hypothetical protein